MNINNDTRENFAMSDRRVKEEDLEAPLGSCHLPISEYNEIVIGHGSGGRLSHQLLQKIILPQFQNTFLDTLHDGAVLPVGNTGVAFTTDSYVVDPIFFPGGDIGKLSVNGTVNDLVMCGAQPLFLSVGLVIEEGFPLEDLWRIIHSMQSAAREAGVTIVTGDTKVVDRGKADKIFINTSGIGLMREGIDIRPSRAAVGDKIVLSGPIAAHGIAIMSVREGLEFETQVESDTAPLSTLVSAMLKASNKIHVLRDPTRGGVASALNEIAHQAQVGIFLQEACIPIHDEVKGACEILGLDPLYVANEGKLIAIVPPGEAEIVLQTMREHVLGRDAAIIGEVTSEFSGGVMMKTRIGGTRVVDMLSGEQLPRIC